MINYIINPWRHIAVSKPLVDVWKRIFNKSKDELITLLDTSGNEVSFKNPKKLIIPITSANHSNTRRNPIRWERRIESLINVANSEDIPIFPYLIEERWKMENFSEYTIMSTNIAMANEGNYELLTPENSLILCSNPELIPLYQELGYTVIDALSPQIQWQDNKLFSWQILNNTLEKYSKSPEIALEYAKSHLHQWSYNMYKKYNFFEHSLKLYEDNILNEDWNFDNTVRDYRIYEESFQTASPRKYEAIKKYIRKGVLVDIWCAWWWLIACAAQDPKLNWSTFIWVEMSRTLYEVAKNNMKKIDYPHTHIYHGNGVDELFIQDSSVDTITSISTTHEVISYWEQNALKIFANNIHRKLTPKWVWINMDVVWPNDKNKQVIAELDTQDWLPFDESAYYAAVDLYNSWIKSAFSDIEKQEVKQVFSDYLATLSTFWRLFVFQKSFIKTHGDAWYKFDVLDYNTWTVLIRNQDLYEFMPKVDYLKNRFDECNEAFCTMSCNDRKEFWKEHWFETEVIPDRNQWIYENRYWKINPNTKKQRFSIYEDNNWKRWKQLTFEPTNVKVILKKIPERIIG